MNSLKRELMLCSVTCKTKDFRVNAVYAEAVSSEISLI